MAYLALAALLGGLAAAPPVRAGDPASTLQAVRATRLDATRAVAVRNVRLPIGPAWLHIGRGILIPTAAIEGRTVELVLIGQAQFHLDPPDAIEAGQLELFTGRSPLDTPVEEAVLVLADAESVDRLLGRPAPQPAEPSVFERAQALHERWLASTERRNTGAEAGIYRALTGDRAYASYFAIWCLSHEAGEFVYTNDPEDAEQITVASFKRLDVRGWDRIRLARHIRFQQRKGRYLGMTVDDVGAWDIWLSSRWSGEKTPPPGSEGFEARHYDLDVTIARHSLRLEGTATLQIEATESGRRTLSLDLFRDLEVDSVTDGAGRPLFAFRSGPEVIVDLQRSSRVGETLTLRVAFAGQALEWVGRKTFDLVSTDNWYPHCGSVDRATYDARIRWPQRYDLLANGHVVEEGRGDKYRWQRRTLDIPSIAFSFAMGKFDVTRHRLGHVTLTLAISRSGGAASPEVRDKVVDTIRRSLEFFEMSMGPYPLDELTAVVLPRDYSQSYLGLVTLTETVAQKADSLPPDAARWIRETTIAHEIAHQWWGNLVGWWSYRDQWLSEATANYVGLLFHSRSTDGDSASLAQMSAGWRATLEQPVASGRTVESLGPIVLGNRLNSSEAGNGYRAIVYRKGAVVLAMLARAVGEERFLSMLGQLARAADGKVLTTEAFLQSIGRMSGLDLDGFARQYIYGTGIPLVYYDYHFERAEDAWVVSGQAHRLVDSHFVSRVVRRPDGAWDIVRDPLPDRQSSAVALVVPYRIVSIPTERDAPGVYSGRSRAVEDGGLMLRGNGDAFEIPVSERPGEFVLDPRGEILARFYSARTSPKRYERCLARNEWNEGHMTDAEQHFLAALKQPLGTLPDAPVLAWLRNEDSDRRREDAASRLGLARLYLDQDREEEARQQLTACNELLEQDPDTYRMERDVISARLALREARFDEVYRQLKETVRLAAPVHTRRDWNARMLQLRLRSERESMAEAYALLAVAAHQTGHPQDFEWALAGARERGVDVTLLEPHQK